MTNAIPINTAIAAIAITVIVMAAVIALVISVPHRKDITQPSLSHKMEVHPPHLYVLTSTDGQFCFLRDGRFVATSDIDEARYLQAGLMEHGTMTVITVYIPERVL